MTRTPAALIAAAFVSAAAAGCSAGSSGSAGSSSAASPAAVDAAAHAINDTSLLQHIKDLSADSMEGRAPGTTGEQRAVAYMQGQFKAIGLAPGNPDGTYLQNVDLIGYTAHPTASFTAKGKTVALRYPDDYIANSRHNRPETNIDNSDVVFVGYGVVAPEYGWDDYKGVDVKGKTILMLVNDPPVRLANDTALDTTMFKGRAMTYYGRWTYKYEIASDKGAAAAIIIHETGPAGYPYDVVKSSNSQEQFDVITPDADKRVPVEGWITLDKAKELLRDAGQNFDALKAAAARKDFKPVPLDAKATIHVKIDARQVQSHNVVAKLDGSDKKDEYVVYTAHWDHLGIGPKVNGDSIYNGAADNASGSSALLEIAKAYKKLPTPPRRSILFLSVTAEEKGLLGAKYYATHPLYPLAKTAADINMDGVNLWGRTSDFTVIGLGNSTLDDVLTNVLAADGRTVRPDAEPEKGFYYRSDHFEFAKVGVPALDPDAGVNFIGKPANYGVQARDEYTTKHYHQPSDEVSPDWDLSGAVDDLRVLFKVGDTVANADSLPTWKPGTEFKARRDSMMAARK
ncbi:MAG TPA: M28 family metallopeptidase [Gemmatimonadaceae bacterium]|nr:M28 family metallopeptidase [Gemmatimonadaceae bacterium]